MANMNHIKRISVIGAIWILLTLLLLAYLLQVANMVAYGGAITAGELLAFVEANGYEATDVWDYCMRYIWPYWLVICCVFVGLLYLAWRLFTRGTRFQRIVYSAIVALLFIPLCFPLQHTIFHETMCVVHEIHMIRSHYNNNKEFVYNAKRTDIPEGKEIYVLAIGESLR
jgi:glucan phosphoethanolaminetransferase (alkaline phosphatase superfamily)